MMDNQIKRILTRKNIFIALGVVVVLELIWAAVTLTKPAQQKTTSVQPVSQVTKAKPTTISLQASQNQLKVGEKVTVSITISTDKPTDGTDIIIDYDPKLLSVETIAQTKQPVVLGTIYNDYPVNSLDSKNGRITVSGVSIQQGGLIPNGLFGAVTFVAKAAGSAKVSLQFTPGSTVDSNVIESGTGKDVLEKVENLEININP